MPKEKTYNEKIAAIRKEVDESTIPDMIKALYQMVTGAEILANQIFNRINGVYAKYNLRAKENSVLKGLTDYCKFTRMATAQFQARIEPQIQGSTFDFGSDAKEGEQFYSNFNRNSSNLVFFCLTAIDRLTNDAEAFDKILDTFDSIESKGIFTEDDLNRFAK